MSSLTGSVKDWHVPWKHQRTMPPLENIVKRSNMSWRIISCKFRFKIKSYSQNASELHQRFNFDPRLPIKGFEKVRRRTYSHEFSCCLRSCNSCDTTCERPTLRKYYIYYILRSTTYSQYYHKYYIFPVLPQHCYCVCIAFEHWLFPAKSFVRPTPLVSRGVVTLSINFSFAVFFLTCATDFPQKEELTVV